LFPKVRQGIIAKKTQASRSGLKVERATMHIPLEMQKDIFYNEADFFLQ